MTTAQAANELDVSPTLSITQAAKELGISRTSMYRLIDDGKFELLRPISAQGKMLIKRPSFEYFIQKHTIKATAYGKDDHTEDRCFLQIKGEKNHAGPFLEYLVGLMKIRLCPQCADLRQWKRIQNEKKSENLNPRNS